MSCVKGFGKLSSLERRAIDPLRVREPRSATVAAIALVRRHPGVFEAATLETSASTGRTAIYNTVDQGPVWVIFHPRLPTLVKIPHGANIPFVIDFHLTPGSLVAGHATSPQLDAPGLLFA